MSDKPSSDSVPQPPPKQEWITPAIVDLPPLVDLTLQTGGAIPGGGGGDGSTVF